MNSKSQQDQPQTTDLQQYVVVARRYRPQLFSDLVGQNQVSTALSNAIDQNRVGHAYLFTGARGVGKTSTARIFAKCLNCMSGPTTEPCGECDVCQGIACGEDVDVLEIDGASNRGIEEIRQLRANANVRPSRARFKIYIIDEVHMLTVQAFNALLKTLEEPPQHVKFMFCTTDPEKIPITVLSRCQRFDFPPIQTETIKQRLQQIIDQEQIQADDDALEFLARRAGGSMRDSQSLLEQLLSVATGSITLADVNQLLGTADFGLVFEIAECMLTGQAASSLQSIERAISGGVDAGQLTEQLLGLLRDAMAARVGCGGELMLSTSADDWERLQALSQSVGVEQLLAAMQTLDQTLVKIRQSAHVRTLIETAVVRICHLENIDQIPALIAQLQSAQGVQSKVADKNVRSPKTGSRTAKKNDPVSPRHNPPEDAGRSAVSSSPVHEATDSASRNDPSAKQPEGLPVSQDPNQGALPQIDWDESDLPRAWHQVLSRLGDMTADVASSFKSLEMSEPSCLVVTLNNAIDRDLCCRPDRKKRLEQAILDSTGRTIRLDFRVDDENTKEHGPQPVVMTKRQRTRQLEQQEFVRKAIELFDIEIVDLKAPRQKPK